eukprot:scaffold61146_cov57-Phaeocystis_antarctica.AAC.1
MRWHIASRTVRCGRAPAGSGGGGHRPRAEAEGGGEEAARRCAPRAVLGRVRAPSHVSGASCLTC